MKQAILTMMVALVASHAFAQSDQTKPAPERAAQETRRPGGFMGPGMRGGPGIERVFSVLTDEQRTSLREAMEGEREKVRDLEEKLRDARRALFDAALAQKFDESAIREKAEASAKLEAEITVIRAKAFAKLKPPLSAEQLQKVREAPAAAGR